MHKKAFLLVMLSMILTSGCASFTVKKDYSLSEGSQMGLVVVSFTQPFPVMKWMYHDLREGKGARGVNEKFISTTDKFNQLIKYGDTIVYTIELPEGEYEFFRWTTVEIGTYLRSTEDFSLKFRSVAGKVTYVGNIFVFMGGRKYSILIRDNHEKEIPLFMQHYRNIREDQIEVRLMENEANKKKAPEKPQKAPGIEAMIRNQRTEVGGRRSEVRGQRSAGPLAAEAARLIE